MTAPKPHIRIEGGRPHVYASPGGLFDCYGSFEHLAEAWWVIKKRIALDVAPPVTVPVPYPVKEAHMPDATPSRIKPIATIKKGELVAFTTGEYSDYAVAILLKAKSDFTNDDMNQAIVDSECMLKSEPLQLSDGTWFTPKRRFDEDKLIAYLAALGCFKEVPARAIHLGDYGKLKIEDSGTLAVDWHDHA